MDFNFDDLTSIIKERIAEMMFLHTLDNRYVMTLIPRLIDMGMQDDCLELAAKMVAIVSDYGNTIINKPPNFMGLHINKLMYLSDRELSEFIDDMTVDHFRVLIKEEKLIVDCNLDILQKEFITKSCAICCSDKFELMNGFKKYISCSNCYMPITE